MAIRITIPDDPRAVRHGVAPLMEAALSLHVLVDAKGHPLQHPWVRAMHGLSPAFKRELRQLRWVFVDGQPDCFLPAVGGAESFESALGRVAALTEDDAAHEFARPLYFYSEPEAGGPQRLREPGMREALLHIADRDGPGCRETAALIFDDPAALRDRLVALLAGYWEQAFAREWARLAPRLEAEAEACRDRFSTPHFWGEFAALRPAVVADADARTLTRRSGHRHHVESTPQRPLLLLASAYVWPHVRINCDAPWPLALVYPPPAMAREARPEPPPEELVGAMRALADPVRLRALRLLAQRERSTEELAPLLQIGEAGLSRHLRLLLAAGLVRTRRSGYYVLYAADRDRVAILGRELAAYVDEAGS